MCRAAASICSSLPLPSSRACRAAATKTGPWAPALPFCFHPISCTWPQERVLCSWPVFVGQMYAACTSLLAPAAASRCRRRRQCCSMICARLAFLTRFSTAVSTETCLAALTEALQKHSMRSSVRDVRSRHTPSPAPAESVICPSDSLFALQTTRTVLEPQLPAPAFRSVDHSAFAHNGSLRHLHPSHARPAAV